MYRKEYQKLWRENHKEKYLSRKRELRKLKKEYNKPYKDLDPVKRLFYAAKKRAKEKGILFTIDESDIKIPTICPYLGIPLELHVPRGYSRTCIASLDRVDNSKGYEKGNIEVISHLANTMKSNATTGQLLNFAKTILARYG